MRWFLHFYVLVAVISAAVALVPGLPTYLVLFTFGIALPLLFAPTLLIYMTASWPLLDAIRAHPPSRIGAITGLFVVLAVALLPGGLSRLAVWKDATAFTQDDVAGVLSAPPRRLEIQQASQSYGGPFDPLLSAPCDRLCQGLLLNRELDEIRISVQGSKGDRTERAAVVYSYEQRSGCPRAFANANQALRETQLRASRGECIVARIDGGWQASPKLLVTAGRDWPATWSLHTERRFTRYELFESPHPGARRLVRQTDLDTSVLAIPLSYGPLPSYGLNIRMGLRRTAIKASASDIETILRRFAGLRVEPLRDSPDEPAVVTVESILSSSTTEPFGPELMASINRYVDQLRTLPTLNSAQQAVVYRLMADQRVTDHFGLSQLFQKWPHLVGPAIGSILQRLEQPAPESVGHNQSHLAWILVQTPIESLRPFASRILSTAALSTDWHYAPLLRVTGRIGVDPTELLLARLRGTPSHARTASIIAVCMADEPWHSRLLPEVEILLRRSTAQSYRGQEELIAALLALGEDNPSANAFLARLPQQDAKRLRFDADYRRRHDCSRG